MDPVLSAWPDVHSFHLLKAGEDLPQYKSDNILFNHIVHQFYCICITDITTYEKCTKFIEKSTVEIYTKVESKKILVKIS